MPPVPTFYTRPETIADLVTQTAARALDVLGIEVEALKRWPTDAGRVQQIEIDDEQ
jgi:4-hydroxy-3-polyprenylbenzoate decarboxylase